MTQPSEILKKNKALCLIFCVCFFFFGIVNRYQPDTVAYSNLSQEYTKAYIEFVELQQGCKLSMASAEKSIMEDLSNQLSKNGYRVVFDNAGDKPFANLTIKLKSFFIDDQKKEFANISQFIGNFLPHTKAHCQRTLSGLELLESALDKILIEKRQLSKSAILAEYKLVLATKNQAGDTVKSSSNVSKFSPPGNLKLFGSEVVQNSFGEQGIVELSLLMCLWLLTGLAVGLLVSGLISKLRS